MTEKRFRRVLGLIEDSNGDLLDLTEIADKMNQLNDENKELKKENKRIKINENLREIQITELRRLVNLVTNNDFIKDSKKEKWRKELGFD